MADEVTPGRVDRVEALCLEALSKDGAARAVFLEEACGEDAGLRAEVESLLAGRSAAGSFLETPAWAPGATPLTPGTTLGPYKIVSLIGVGGMGEVYEARDTRLDRTVAIKVLPPALAADPARRARFEREAKAIAALQHPHICTLYDLGRESLSDGGPEGGRRAGVPVDFLVMEHLEGQTLAARLEKGRVPLDQALTIGAEIADALAAAHRQGVTHRDLKPANVMLTRAGGVRPGSPQVKLLDFGLAKLKGHGEQPAVSSLAAGPRATLTAEGTIVGTLQYMAPEQLEGKPADERADIWALGAILYEMLSGQRAFDGTSAASLVVAILEHEPAPLPALAPLTPPPLDRVVLTCLEKDPDARWQAAGDVARELRWIADDQRRGRDGRGAPSGAATRRRGRLLAGAVALAAVAVLAASFWLWQRANGRRLPPPRVVHLTTTPGSSDSPALDFPVGLDYPDLSTDGKQVAFQWTGENDSNTDIYVKLVGETASHRLTTDPAIDRSPCWSPDGSLIAFQRRDEEGKWAVLTMSALGGAERKLADLPGLHPGMSWSPDGRWLAFSSEAASDHSAGVYLLPVSGGEPVRITSPPPPAQDRRPSFSSDGRSLAFIRGVLEISADIFIQALPAGGRPEGAPRRIPVGMVMTGLAWHPDGRSILFGAQTAYLLSHLYRVSTAAGARPERVELAGHNVYRPTTSRKGNRLAFADRTVSWGIGRLVPGRGSAPLVRSSLDEWGPRLSSDGRRLAFTSNRNGETTEVWTANADGTNVAQLTHGPGRNQGSACWSPDGRWIAFDSQGFDATVDIHVISSNGGQPRRVTSDGSNEIHPTWSRDGKWIYFRSDRSGRGEIWRTPVAGGPSQRMTRDGADLAFESFDGRTLFYSKAGGELRAKPLDGGPERRLVERLTGFHFAVVEGGIYYWGPPGSDRASPLLSFDLSSDRTTELDPAAPLSGAGLTVSQDRQSVIYTSSLTPRWNLMLIENFR